MPSSAGAVWPSACAPSAAARARHAGARHAGARLRWSDQFPARGLSPASPRSRIRAGVRNGRASAAHIHDITGPRYCLWLRPCGHDDDAAAAAALARLRHAPGGSIWTVIVATSHRIPQSPATLHHRQYVPAAGTREHCHKHTPHTYNGHTLSGMLSRPAERPHSPGQPSVRSGQEA